MVLSNTDTKEMQAIIKSFVESASFQEILKSMISNVVHEAVALVRDALTSEIKKLKGEVRKLSSALEKQEQYSRRNNIIIRGLKEKSNENTLCSVKEFFKETLKVDVPEFGIDKAHWVGPKRFKNRSVIVKFANYQHKQMVYNTKKQLRGTGFTIHEDLTKVRYDISKEASQTFGLRNSWTYDGAVYIKTKDEVKHKVQTVEELRALMKTYAAEVKENLKRNVERNRVKTRSHMRSTSAKDDGDVDQDSAQLNKTMVQGN